jgi:hypothetical protein
MNKMERSDFDYDPARDEPPKKVRWILVFIALGMAVYLSTFLV